MSGISFYDALVVILSYAAASLNLIGWGLYLKGSFSATIKGDPLSWFLSLVLVINAVVIGYLGSGGISSVAMYVAGLIPCSLAFYFAIKNTGFSGFNPRVVTKLILAFALLVLISISENPVYAAIFLSGFYLIAGFNTASAIYHGAAVEQPLPWAVWVFAAISQLIVALAQPWYVALIPATNLFCWGLALVMILRTPGRAVIHP